MVKKDKQMVDENIKRKANHVNIFTSPELKDYDFRAYFREISEMSELEPVGKERLL